MSDCQSHESVSQINVNGCKPGHGNPAALDASICQNNQNLGASKFDPCCKTKIENVNMVNLKNAANDNLNSVSKTCATK